jgi:2-oxoglutarate ferredoxin oxidoreductase subunit delta
MAAKTNGTVEIATDLCKGCGLCVLVCPENVLKMTEQLNAKGWPIVALVADGCTGCTFCGVACPDGVFTIFREDLKVKP